MAQIETFSKADFEAVLPVNQVTGAPLWTADGLAYGEYVYYILVPNTNKRLYIRSSVHSDGTSAATGQDSIRAWIEYLYKDQWRSMGKGPTSVYTTRLPGWQARLVDKLRQLYKVALADSKAHQRPTPAPVVEAAPPVLDLVPTPAPKADPFVFLAPVPLAELPAPKSYPANPDQDLAIHADPTRPLRVLAPPGSGKTYVLSLRYGYLIAQGAPQEDSYAVTFSKTMATELGERIFAANPELDQSLVLRNVCTIHALCKRILSAEGDKRTLPRYFELKKAVTQIVASFWHNPTTRPGWTEVLAYIEYAKSECLDEAHDMQAFADVADRWGSNVGRQLHQCRAKFDSWLRSSHLITFADMLYEVDYMLQSPAHADFLQRWQARVKYLIIDEGQDTSAQAMRILTTLAQPQNQLTIVGDANQLLYRFTGATPEDNLYQGFESRYPAGNTITLRTNYRSTAEIISSYSRLIANNYEPIGPYPAKYLQPIDPGPNAFPGAPIDFSMYPTPGDEAFGVVSEIANAISMGRHAPDDYFVAARTRAQLGYLEGPLTALKVPYINLSGTNFWGLGHVKDVVSYLKLAYNPADSVAFQRIFNIASSDMVAPWGDEQGSYCPHRWLGKSFLRACTPLGSDTPLYTQLDHAVRQDPRAFSPGADDLTIFMARLQAIMASSPVADTLLFIINECYEDHLRADEGIVEDAESGKLDDLTTVVDIAYEYGNNLPRFLDFVSAAESAAALAKDGDWAGHVILSTIHKLKGLERPVVYGIGQVEGINSQGLPVGLLPHTYSMRPPDNRGILPTGGKGRIEDERCMAYVLISRAKDECHLTGCNTYRTSVMSPSRFIHELGLA